MAVFRVNKNKNYTVMSNYHCKDKNLSLKAKGLLSQMLSLPEDWDYTVAGLCAINKENKTAIKTALAELKDAGYLKVTKLMPNQTENGRIEYIYDIYEKLLQQEKQGIENLYVENQLQLNTNKLNTNKLNTNNKKERKKEIFDDIFIKKNVDGELKEAFIELIKSRKLNKKSMTNRALELAIDKVRKLENTEERQIAVINQTIENGWQGLFPLKDNIIKKVDISKKEIYNSENDKDISWKRIFAYWNNVLGYEPIKSVENVLALKKLLNLDGEDGVKKLIVALRMRSEYNFLTKEIKNVSDFKNLLDNRETIWVFYNKNQKEWENWAQKSQEGKKRWQM